MIHKKISNINKITEFDGYGHAKLIIKNIETYDEFYQQIINSDVVYHNNRIAWVNDYNSKYHGNVYPEFTKKYSYIHNAVIIDVASISANRIALSFARNLEDSDIIYVLTKNSYSVELI